MLFESGANIEAPNVDGKTAFLIAAQKGHLRILDFLLEKGASHDVRDKNGKVQLIWLLQREE